MNDGPVPDRAVEVSVHRPSSELAAVEAIASAIENATVTVDAVVYKFKSRRIARALASAADAGCALRLLVNAYRPKGVVALHAPKRLTSLAASARNVQVRTWTESKLHAKLVVIDGALALSGSPNWTKSAERKNTELIVAATSTALVKCFDDQFHELWHQGQPWSPGIWLARGGDQEQSRRAIPRRRRGRSKGG